MFISQLFHEIPSLFCYTIRTKFREKSAMKLKYWFKTCKHQIKAYKNSNSFQFRPGSNTGEGLIHRTTGCMIQFEEVQHKIIEVLDSSENRTAIIEDFENCYSGASSK